jgi:hypothetical protein
VLVETSKAKRVHPAVLAHVLIDVAHARTRFANPSLRDRFDEEQYAELQQLISRMDELATRLDAATQRVAAPDADAPALVKEIIAALWEIDMLLGDADG